MNNLRQQNTTLYPVIFLMVDSSDNPKTGLTPTIVVSKNGGAFASPSGTITEIANGFYSFAGNATDRNTLGTLTCYVTATGAKVSPFTVDIVSYDPFLYGGASPSEISDAVWDEGLTAATHNVPTSSGRRLRQLGSNLIYEGTVVSATSNTITLDSGASSVDGTYDPSKISITSGTGDGQTRNILQYIGATRTCVLDRNLRVLPVLGDEININPDAGREHVNEGLAQAGTVNTITLNANASAFDNTYVGQVIFIRSGTGQDQACRVTAYDGTTKIATMAKNWHTIPDATSAYSMLPTSILDLNMFIQNIWAYSTRSLTTYGTLVADIWANVTRTLTSGGGSSLTAQQVWEYASRTLTVNLTSSEIWNYVKRTLTPGFTTTDTTDTVISCMRGDTFEHIFTGLDLTNFDKAYFTVKKNYKDEDCDSVIQIGTDEGLIYLNACKSSTGTGAELVADEINSTITVRFDPVSSKQFIYSSSYYFYDLEIINTAGDVSTPEYGNFTVIRDVTKKIA